MVIGGEHAPRWQIGLGRENGVLFWTMMLFEASFASYYIFLTLYIVDLGATAAQVGWLIGFWGIARLMALATSGLLLDRFPAVPLIAITRLSGVAGLIVAALLQHWWLLPLAFILLGIANIAIPAISSLIAAGAADADRARAFTLIYTVAPGIATVIAPLISGAVAAQFGLRATLLLGAAFSTLSIVGFSRLHSPPRKATSEAPATYREALANAPVRTICLLLAATVLILTIGTTLASNFLHDVHGLDYTRIGQFGSIGAVGSILLGVAFARIKAVSQPLVGIVISLICTCGMFGLLLFVKSLPLLMFAYLLRGGYMVAWSLFSAALGNVTPARLYGRAFALIEFCAAIGMMLAPFIAGELYARHPATPFGVALACSLPLILIIANLARQPQATMVSVETLPLTTD